MPSTLNEFLEKALEGQELDEGLDLIPEIDKFFDDYDSSTDKLKKMPKTKAKLDKAWKPFISAINVLARESKKDR